MKYPTMQNWGGARFTPETVAAIFEMRAAGMTNREIAGKYRCWPKSINKVLRLARKEGMKPFIKNRVK